MRPIKFIFSMSKELDKPNLFKELLEKEIKECKEI